MVWNERWYTWLVPFPTSCSTTLCCCSVDSCLDSGAGADAGAAAAAAAAPPPLLLGRSVRTISPTVLFAGQSISLNFNVSHSSSSSLYTSALTRADLVDASAPDSQNVVTVEALHVKSITNEEVSLSAVSASSNHVTPAVTPSMSAQTAGAMLYHA